MLKLGLSKLTQIPMFQSKWDKPLSQLKFQNLHDNVETESQIAKLCSISSEGASA